MIRVILSTAVAAALISAPAADGATKNGITPIAPKKGSTVAVGSRPTFKMKVEGSGTVWVHVCKKPRLNGDGLICHKEMIKQARKKDGKYQVRADFFDFPAFWLNSPGTYYWQAHRIKCEGGVSDCRQEGPVVKFRVG